MGSFLIDGDIWGAFSETSDPERRPTFDVTTYIYGLEMVAIVATVLNLCDFVRNKNVVFYIDNSNAKGALVKGSPLPRLLTEWYKYSD